MRIEITRSGGFGGLTRSWSLEVSRTEAEERWLPLAAEAGASTDPDAATSPEGQTLPAPSPSAAPAIPSGARTGVQRDRFTYHITIGYTEVYLPENELNDPWRELIERARSGTPANPPAPPGNTGSPSGDPDPGPSSELL